jgi:nucleotide-binding universal stress UspA family protein
MPVEPMGPVVVGVDGTPTSLAAVDLATEEAAARVVPLVIVHGFEDGPQSEAAARARLLLEVVAARVGSEHPGLAVDPRTVPGKPTDVLAALSGEACLLVVGHRDRRPGRERPAGSIAVSVAGSAASPVLVHRQLDTSHDVPQPRPVLVGVSDGPNLEPVLELGFLEASLRGAPLLAVHVQPGVRKATESDLAVAAAVGAWAEKYPGVPVSRLVRIGLDVPVVLTAASRSAQLVVVGAVRHPGGLRPGSVSEVLVRRAGCPVAVVPAGDTLGF